MQMLNVVQRTETIVRLVSPEWASMGDAAFASGLFGTSFDCGGGYLASPNTYHAWTETDWDTLPGRKLPIWEAAGRGSAAGTSEGKTALGQLHALGVPAGRYVVAAMETRVDAPYVDAFGLVMHDAGYLTVVYGSASTVFGNPSRSGYWVADYAGIGPFMYSHPGVIFTQWTAGPKYDTSTVDPATLGNFWT